MIGTTKFFVKACWPIATRIALKETLTRNSHYATISKIPIPKFVSSPSIASINKEFSLNFKSLEPRKSLKNQSCRESRLNFDFLKNYQRTFMFRRKDKPKNHGKRIPKLILIQNPFSWLMVKIDFTVLRHVWDPQFQEKEFKFGTKQAISRVTEVISKGQLGDLNGLLTKAARLSLLRELDHNWSEKQRHLLFLQFEDIQISSPRKVYFIRIAGTVLFTFVVSHNLKNADKKFCDVDMAFLALKWVPINSIDALIFTEIFARFHRDYTPHSIPEWTIAYFKVTRFEVLRR